MQKLRNILKLLEYERDNDIEILFEHDLAISKISCLFTAINNLKFYKSNNQSRKFIKRKQKKLSRMYLDAINSINTFYLV